MTCGKVIANKWKAFQEKVKNHEGSSKDKDELKGQLVENFEVNYKGKLLDEIGITKICCRRHLLTHVDLVDIL